LSIELGVVAEQLPDVVVVVAVVGASEEDIFLMKNK
jgi:hypothetical protein